MNFSIIHYDILKNKVLYTFKFALIFRATKYGIQTTMYTILDDNIEHLSGKYFSECGHQMLMKHATDEALAAELWEKSMKMVELTAEDL